MSLALPAVGLTPPMVRAQPAINARVLQLKLGSAQKSGDGPSTAERNRPALTVVRQAAEAG